MCPASTVLHCSRRLPFSPRRPPTAPNRAPPFSFHPEPRSPLPPSAHHHHACLSPCVSGRVSELRLACTARRVARPILCADFTPSIAALFVVPTRRVWPRVTRREPRPLRSNKCARRGSALGRALRPVARPIVGRDRSRVFPWSTATLPRSSRPLRAISDASSCALPAPHPRVARALPPWLARKPHADHTQIQLQGPRRNVLCTARSGHRLA